ncbi:MAG TPA: hypothetical protein VKG38_14040 [Solirubrobacteraceae bacterium]|nr:hypothetical protein [Solirubrobacteraceae bacterium]
MSRDFDAELAQALQEAEALKSQMAEALAVWLDATARWAADFWERSIAEAVDEEPDAVIALADSDRRAVKDDVARLIAEARPHIQRRLVDDRAEDWPHLKPQVDPDDGAFRPPGTKGPFYAGRATRAGGDKSVPELVEGRLNGVLGDVASVFSQHGLQLPGFEHGDPYGHKGQWHPNRLHKPEWSDEMVDAMAGYGALHERYVVVLAQIESIGGERKHYEASSLWERA